MVPKEGSLDHQGYARRCGGWNGFPGLTIQALRHSQPERAKNTKKADKPKKPATLSDFLRLCHSTVLLRSDWEDTRYPAPHPLSERAIIRKQWGIVKLKWSVKGSGESERQREELRAKSPALVAARRRTRDSG